MWSSCLAIDRWKILVSNREVFFNLFSRTIWLTEISKYSNSQFTRQFCKYQNHSSNHRNSLRWITSSFAPGYCNLVKGLVIKLQQFKIKETETWQHNLVGNYWVVNIYFFVRNQRNNYLLVSGTSAFSLNKNNLFFFVDFFSQYRQLLEIRFRISSSER